MMRSRTQLILGPAGSGKTAYALRAYAEVLCLARPATSVWITPSGRSARLVGGLLSIALPRNAVLAPGIYTFATLADAVLRASRRAVRRLGTLEKRELIAELVDDAAKNGRLRYFLPIAGTSGLIDLLSQFIADWKRLEIWPEELRAAAERRGLTPKDAELASIYERYQSLLAKHDWFDAEGQIWLARALLREGQEAPFAKLDCLVADGFSDFTRTEHEIIELLAARADSTIVTLLDEPGDERQDLFAKARRTANQFQDRHPECEVVRVARSATSRWPAMAHLENRLFGHPRRMVDAPSSERIEFIAAGRELGELEWIAARIKSLLVDGDPSDRTPVAPEDIVVAFRSLDAAAPLLREAFSRFGIPYYLEKSRRLIESPLVVALLQLARLQAEDWPYRELLATLNQNYCRPSWPEWSDASVREAEQLVRAAQAPRGRAAILAACARNEARTSATESPPTANGRALLERIAATVGALKSDGGGAEWLAALESVARELGYFASPSADDRVAWRLLEEAGATMTKLRGALGRESAMSLAEFVDWLREVASVTPLPQEHDEVGRVRILAAASLRALEAPYLFLAGLSERSFPAADRAGSVYSEAECRALVEVGLPLPLRAERAQDEMLLFYETLTRARRRLCLSYPAIDERAQPLSPSPYLTEAERAFGAMAIARSEERDLRPLPRDERLWNERDWRLSAVLKGAEGHAARLAGLLTSNVTPGAASNVLAGLDVVRERATGQGFGPFEGMLFSPAARSSCARRFDAERVWSATDLELYGACPHKFFLARVLGVEPLDEAELSTDFQGRGARMHQALAALHRRINVLHEPGTSPHTLDAETYAELIEHVLQSSYLDMATERSLVAALKQVERLELQEWLLAYPEQHQKYAGATGPAQMLPLYFEAAFGMRRDRREDEPARDDLSVEECLELQSGDDVVRIAGRIDRIDVAEVGGHVVFNVLDYKTGKPPSKNEIAQGGALQLPLYALAAQRLLLKDHDARPWQFGYWSVSDQGFKEGAQLWASDGEMLAPTQSWQDLWSLIERSIFAMVRGMRRGEFPMASADPHCTSRCEFRRVCRVNQTRALEKTWQPPTEKPST
jgi:ATP-dependent helicase/nuclease subunit B